MVHLILALWILSVIAAADIINPPWNAPMIEVFDMDEDNFMKTFHENVVQAMVQEMQKLNKNFEQKLNEQRQQILNDIQIVQKEFQTNLCLNLKEELKVITIKTDNLKNDYNKVTDNLENNIKLLLENQVKTLQQDNIVLKNKLNQLNTELNTRNKINSIENSPLDVESTKNVTDNWLDNLINQLNTELNLNETENVSMEDHQIDVRSTTIGECEKENVILKNNILLLRTFFKNKYKNESDYEHLNIVIDNQRKMTKFQYENLQKELENMTHEQELQHKLLDNIWSEVKTYPSTCDEAVELTKSSGIYHLKAPHLNEGKRFAVYCEIDPTGSGNAWTIIQKRINGTVDFYRNWSEYKRGFGDVDGEYFVGLDILHELTNSTKHELWIQLELFNGTKHDVQYSSFSIGNELDSYVLRDLGKFTGNVGNAFEYNVGSKFTTKDVDNDRNKSYNCAILRHGAWWHNICTTCNLNGNYPSLKDDGVHWKSLPLKYTHMAIRPSK